MNVTTTLTQKGQIKLLTSEIVIAEIAWVLSSFCQETRRSVAEKLRQILLFRGLNIPNQDILLLATQKFESQNIDFIDAFIYAFALRKKIKQIYSYDRDLDKLEGVRRLES